jgi:uncharacterized protein YwgA
MQIADFLLLAYNSLGGEVKGSTNLQKKIYFLALMLNEDLGYDAHFYGPYSAQVASANRELKSLGFVQESVASARCVDQRGFEIARHDFTLTSDGKAVAEILIRRLRQSALEIQEAATKLQALAHLDYMQLSIAAKAYFLLGQHGGRARVSDLVEKAREFNWQVNEYDIQQAAKSLQDIGLASELGATSFQG